jgi:hypothetical protein
MEIEAVKRLVPKNQRGMITPEFCEKVEKCVNDPVLAEQVKSNFISYLNVLSTGKFSMDEYLNAVKYVSFKLLNYTNRDAYAATFPDRWERMVKEGVEEKRMDAYVAMYNKSKLVMAIYEQTIVPTYVLNAPLHQEALNVLAKMIKDPSVRGMAKVKACEAILTHTKQPEIVKGELTIGLQENETIAELREVTEQLANTFRASIGKGKTLQDVAEAQIIDVKVEEIE